MVKEGQKITLSVCRGNIRDYYREKGYDCEIGTILQVDAKDLSPSSHKKIKYICDYCGKEFERIVYSNERSKQSKNNLKDSCVSCSKSKRAKETCQIKYGVDNPMQVQEFIEKQRKSTAENENFSGSSPNSCSTFVHGIPVSQAQLHLAKHLPDFELNQVCGRYYIDLAYNDIAIEYNGRGHDMELRMGKITKEDFQKKRRKEKRNSFTKSSFTNYY